MITYQHAVRLLQYWGVATDPVEKELVLEMMVNGARQHPGLLAPLCFTVDRIDLHGQPLPMFPEPFHWQWLDHFMEERVFLLLAARGHGKSEYASAVYAAWLLGTDPRLRILHVTASDTLATMYSRRLQDILCSAAFRMIFPDFPGPGRKWSEHEWYLDIGGLRDPSWRCASVESRIVGARVDVILCFPGHTKIDTKDGSATIRDIRVGDLVRTHTGAWQRVTRCMSRHFTGVMVELQTASSTVVATPDHPFLVGGRWVPAKDIGVGDALTLPGEEVEHWLIPPPVPNRHSKVIHPLRITADVARWIGLYVAEGCIKGPNSIAFTIGSHETALEEFILRIGSAWVGNPTIDRHHAWATNIVFHAGTVAALFRELFGVGAASKRLSPEIFQWGTQQRAAFLLGCMEGDGRKHTSGAWTYSTASLALRDDLVKIAQSLGITSTSVVKIRQDGSTFGGTDSYRFYINATDARKVRTLASGDAVVRGVKRVRNHTGTVYNISVDADNSYVANGFVVHNCDDIVSQDNSRTINGRNTIMGWYRSTLRPMLVPETGRMLIVGTRYHQEDLYGTFLKGGIRHAIYPAEDEAGSILWPGRFTRDDLEKNKTPPEGSLASYATQYLCQPVDPKGEIFNRDWFPIDISPDDLTEVYWSWDTAVTQSTTADFTVGILGGLGRDHDVYVLDIERGQWEPTTAKNTIVRRWEAARKQYGGRLRAILVEDSQAGRVIQAWIREAAPQIPVLLVSPAGQDKVTRANLIVPYCEARRVHVVEGAGIKPWVDVFLDELAMFTATKRHANDDQVDALVYLICRLLGLAQSRGRVGSVVAVTGTGMR